MPESPFQVASLGILIIFLIIINIYKDHMDQVLCQETLMFYFFQCPKQHCEFGFIIIRYTEEQTDVQGVEGPFLSNIVSK